MGIRSWFAARRSANLDEQDFADEIRAHLSIAADAHVAEGADRRSAELAALKEFGNVTLTTDAARRVWASAWLDAAGDLGRDVRYAARALAKTPAFTATVVGVLAVGIGLNTTVFTMLKSVALTPLAGIPRSARLHELFGETDAGRPVRLSYADYQYLRDHDRSFTGLVGSTLAIVGIGPGPGRAARAVSGELVTGNYFEVLGVRAARGRTLMPSDESTSGAAPVVLLSDGFWRRDLGADPEIVGKHLSINRIDVTIVGVADPAFHGTTMSYDNDVFLPLTMAPRLGFAFDGPQTVQGFLREGLSRAAASTQADALWTAPARDRVGSDSIARLRIAPFWRAPGGPQTYALPTVIVLSGMGLLVLAVACANIAGLVLVRGVTRRGEIAVRLALGAPRTRIVRLLLVENLLLAAPGAVLGMLLAAAGLPVLVGYADWLAAPQRLFLNLSVDRVVVALTVLAACGSALLFGFVPALSISRVNLVRAINEDASPRGASHSPLRAALVIGQVAVSVLLLVGAGLVMRSFDAARRSNLGFDPRHVTSIRLDLKQNGYDEARGAAFYQRLLDAARGDAAIESATLAAYNPMNLTETAARQLTVEGYEPRRAEDMRVLFNTIGPDYFRTLQVPMQAGRAFEQRDDARGVPAAIVNATLARQFWGSAAAAIGQHLRLGDGGWRTVIGVAADIKYLQVNESPRPYVYLPFLQEYRPNMILHTRAPLDGHVDGARAHVTALDPDLPIDAKSLEERIAGSLVFMNLAAAVLFVFGIAGVLLAALGTYGLVSYAVKQSTHDIGLRLALGAPSWRVVLDFVGRAMRLGAAGAALGVAATLAASRLLGGVLYGVSATDASSLVSALLIVLGTVALAAVGPAWRAARTDPVRALRHQ